MGLSQRYARLREPARRGDLHRVREELDEVHLAAQDHPLWHARCHWAYACLAVDEQRPGLALAELRLVAFAPLASLARRAAGLEPGEPGGDSLLGTVRLRWRPPAARAGAEAADVSTSSHTQEVS